MVCSFIQILGVNSRSKMCLESKYFQERRVSASNHYEAAKLEHIYTQLCREWTQLSDLNPAEHLRAIQEK